MWENSEKVPYFLNKIEDEKILAIFKQRKMELIGGLRVLNSETFNNEEVFELEVKESGEKILVLNQDGFDESNRSNLGLVIPVQNGELGEFMFVRTSRNENGNLEVNYYSKSFKLLSSVTIEPASKSWNVESGDFSNGRVLCGDGVAGCIADAYTNHGWISVWAFVQTAFIPATAAGIAAGCAYINCVQ